MNEKQIAALIVQQKKTNSLLEEILKELRKENDVASENDSNIEAVDNSIPELLANEKNMAFAHVVKNGYVYTFCYGRYIEHKKATAQEYYMYRNAGISAKQCNRNVDK